MRWIYDIGIRAFWLGIVVSSLWNKKARLWLKGRAGWSEKIKNQFSEKDRVLWFHCASLGEFEQGRPVIEMIKKQLPEIKILLTFFSPSGFEKQKNYENADFVSYLPLDTRKNTRKFVKSFPLTGVIFIKYEFWYHYLHTIKGINVPSFLVSGNFRPEQVFFKWYGRWYSQFLTCFSHFFVQDEQSKVLLRKFGFDNVTVTGDTRFDRVAKVVQTNYQNQALEEFSRGNSVIIAGSTWEVDEELLFYACRNLPCEYKWIIAPHELSGKHIQKLKNLFKEHLLFTEIQGTIDDTIRVVIINTIGQLPFLYRYGTIAYVGGGFGKGIHNILEAAAYGLPVIFGPRYKKFREAVELVNLKGAFPVHNKKQLLSILQQQMEDPQGLKTSSDISRNYVLSNSGASSIIINQLKKIF
ncbi:MAG TPA: 3-deoxy-D-manno-octulosonic acid transferase [Bacteroidaceae bacterium]|nr:3-deoxy-D-manno-octulosonic acid transferase [Bacteroidaceae bacterium]